MPMMKRATALFIGRVQGVGFRFTAQGLAREFPVTGYVRNLPDGNVEVVAEGEEEEVKRYLDAVRHSDLSSHIRHVNTHWESVKNEFEGFEIRF